MPLADLAALVFFAVCWLFYEQLLRLLSRDGSLNTDMTVVRAAWMFGPVAMAVGTVGAVSLLVWRQSGSPTARAIRALRAKIEGQDRGLR